MNRESFKDFARKILAPALFAIALSTTAFVHGAWAQKVDDGTESGAENNLFDDDGFRPVWAQKHVAKPAPAKQHVADATPPAPQPQSPADVSIHDRWVVSCRTGTDAKKDCSAALRIVNSDQQLMILWEISRGPKGSLVASMQTPTGVQVQKGVDLKVGAAAVSKLDYAACASQNCVARGAINDSQLGKMAAVEEMTITIHAADNRDVNFKFPMKGLSQAVADVRS